ncbi:binding--dependent transport system inner membrane component family protein [Candidatus Phytoplasma oryzae]|uniref:Binding--dependent transport system inner membrane component family protein n=1 Tax=Candidatus Phytoplasma oryzae TaxID=203274 RepID=A0A139JQZ5_9MOLU|nr:sugar ABC transporter permease [Candidatus Phytoplasma oryzae]KXT29296.1 binding--dependent transport system inner membrane component family protein [Candidatus Phytoplasma oryzae]RAM57573.1 sugar ABC transporter permease [Candidatus Phytoplasma oryzae]
MFEIAGKKNKIHWLYLSLTLLSLIIFTFFPLIKSLIISFNPDYDKFSDTFGNIINFNNYKLIFQDYDFRIAFKNTLILVLFSVPISLFIALMIALILQSIKNYFLKNFFKTCFFLPLLSNTIVMGMVFGMFFYHNFGFVPQKPEGLFNIFLSFFGIKYQNWISLSAPYSHKMFVLIFYNIWTRLSFKIFVFVLALQDINKSYYNAARIDGASKWRIFTQITLPLLIPIIFYQFIIEMLAVFKEYESIIGLFGKRANFRIQTIVGYIYEQLSNSSYNSYSKGAAAAMILFFISIFFTTISFYISKKGEFLKRKK